MKDSAKYIPLETIVKYFMSEANLTGAHYLRLYHLAIRGLTDIGLDITEEVKTEKLTVEANKTVYLPDDYIQWVKVGVINSQGEVATLRRNDSLTTYGMEDNDRLSKNIGEGVRSKTILYDNSYQNYNTSGSLYTLFGVHNNMDYYGEFKVDDANGLILLDNDYSYDYIILEYLSNPAADTDLVVPIQAQEALIAFLRWMDIISMPASRRVNMGEKQIRRKEYYNQRRLAKARIRPFRLWDTNEVIRLNNNLSLKG
jgi:hypothetical protein